MVLWLGIAFNVAFLGYFKYVDFVRGSVNDVFGTNLVLKHIILPLGISFITFQKIAFLIDVQAGRVKSFALQDYCLFVLFFPQLIAGPIVHYREMVPQFHSDSVRFDKENLSVGLTLFFFGLFKKVIFADNIAHFSRANLSACRKEEAVFLFCQRGWRQSDLRCRFTSIFPVIPIWHLDWLVSLEFVCHKISIRHFRRLSIIDFWTRWHMTLT